MKSLGPLGCHVERHFENCRCATTYFHLMKRKLSLGGSGVTSLFKYRVFWKESSWIPVPGNCVKLASTILIPVLGVCSRYWGNFRPYYIKFMNVAITRALTLSYKFTQLKLYWVSSSSSSMDYVAWPVPASTCCHLFLRHPRSLLPRGL
jgi:hypothetical protein